MKHLFKVWDSLTIIIFFCFFSRTNGSSVQSITSPLHKSSLVSCKTNGGGSAYYYITSTTNSSNSNNNNNRQQHQQQQAGTNNGPSAALAAARQRKLQARSADNLLLWRKLKRDQLRSNELQQDVLDHRRKTS